MSAPRLCECRTPNVQRVEGALICNECGEQVMGPIERQIMEHLERLSNQLARLESRTVPKSPEQPGQPSSEGLLSSRDLAARLGVTPAWVRDHSHELGALRLTDGERPRLFFEWETVQERLASCSTGSRAEPAESRSPKPKGRGRRKRSMGTDRDLLPIKGSKVA